MKHNLTAALLALLIALLPCFAGAEAASVRSTQAFIDVLTGMDIACTLNGMDESGSELVTVDISDGATGRNYTVHVHFDASGEAACLSIPAIAVFGEFQQEAVIRACNELNCTYNYTRFIADEAEGTVTVSIDLILGYSQTGEVVLEAFDRLVSIVSEAYPALAGFNE